MIRLALAAAALAGMAASTATAQTGADPVSAVLVHYGDLDLAQPGGMKMLRHRVAMAVDAVCPLTWRGGTEDVAGNMRCRRQAFNFATQEIAALHAQASGSGGRGRP